MKDTNEEYWEVIKGVIGALIVLAIFIIFLLTGCSVFNSFKKSEEIAKSDSAKVKKEKELVSTLDTSKSKSESAYSKETFIFPARDTNIFNINIPKNDYPYPVYYSRESGTKKEEVNNYNYETRERQLIDSMRIVNLEKEISKKSETSGGVLTLGQTLGIAILGIVIIAMVVLFVWLTKKVNVISQIIKTK